MTLSLLSFNARGLRNNLKRKAIFLYFRKFKCDLFFVQEAHNVPADVKFWKGQWGRDLWGAHKSEKAAGVMVLKGNFSGEIIGHECDPEGHFIIFTLSFCSKVLITVNIYGYNSRFENSTLFDTIDERIAHWLGKFPNACLVIGGDFNVVMDNKLDRFPPRNDKPANRYLRAFMEKYELYDVFRKKFSTKAYTWLSKDLTKQSRLDYWLISKSIAADLAEVVIHPAPLSDHKIITLKLSLTPASFIPKALCWKLNNSLLAHEAAAKKIKNLINLHWNAALLQNTFSLQWELLKFEVGKFMRTYSSDLAKSRRRDEEDLCAHIVALSNQNRNLNDSEQVQLSEYQAKLDSSYRRKAEGAFIRSRARWLEEGEQCSSYFFNLETSKTKRQTIDTLKINGKLVSDHKTISSYCSDFYSKLYSSNPDKDSAVHLLESIKTCKRISCLESEWCEKPISVLEIQEAIKNLKPNKSPGNDGLSAEFYKAFSETLSPFLLEMFKESMTKGLLPPSLSQGIITLIPKPKKDTASLENWRPICLLNTDYKILSHILANRIKKSLPRIISEAQSGFLCNRNIANNVRLVLDLLDYSDVIGHDGLILFLDFYKAFDSLEHSFIYQSLTKFGFGNFFTQAIKTLYTNCNSSILLKYGTSPRFKVSRGIRQGCPVAPYLFLLSAQILSSLILESDVQGITVAGREITISQVADDTTLFLKDPAQIPKAINLVNQFSKASGLCLNIQKCELMSIKSSNDSFLYDIPLKNEVNYLGIVITKDNTSRCQLNFDPIIDKTRKKFNHWLQRDLSLNGRVLLAKSEGISRLTYSAAALNVEPKVGRDIDKMLYNFVWKNKTHYIKNSVITNEIKAGGLNFLDFSSLNYTFKINWLRNFLSNPDSVWNFIPKFIFSHLGGLSLLLKCNYDSEKLPVKLSKFHKQMLLAWYLMYNHSFSPHTFPIWNNRNILYKNRSLFFSNWVEYGIVYVKQLFNANDNLMTYSEFLNTYKFPVTPKDFCIVFDAIPSGVVSLFKGYSSTTVRINPIPVSETAIGKICFSSPSAKCNRIIRRLFQKKVVTIPYITHHWRTYVPNIPWDKVWTLSFQYFITNKQREISYKLLHRCYPVKLRLKSHMDTSCSFCKSGTETATHLFWSCSHIVTFWKHFVNCIQCNVKNPFLFFYKDMLFGFFNKSSDQYFIINLLIIMAKYFIHKSKFQNKTPLFSIFLKEIQTYKQAINASTFPKAIKTHNLLEKYGL